MNSDILNSLLYAFSTIPQVLAAFMALYGAFILFTIQGLYSMQRQIPTLRDEIISQAGNTIDAIEGISKVMAEKSNEISNYADSIKIKSKYSFSLGLISIFASICIIPFLPFVCIHILYLILGIILIISAISMILMILVVYSTSLNTKKGHSSE